MDPYFAGAAYGGKTSAELTKPEAQSEAVIEDRTAISDYPGDFDKYSQETFLKIYSEMKSNELLIPQSMRGRDFRIISEDVLVPILVQSESDQKDEQSKKGKKKRGRGKRRRKRKELSGTYYEDDMYDAYGQSNGYYNEYDDGYGGGYYEDGYYGSRSRGYYDENGYYEENGYYAQQQQQRSPRGNRARNQRKRGRGRGGQKQQQQQERKYNSRRNGQSANKKNASSKTVKVWAQKGAKSSDKKKSEKVKVAKPPKPKTYSTKKGVYARKAVAAN